MFRCLLSAATRTSTLVSPISVAIYCSARIAQHNLDSIGTIRFNLRPKGKMMNHSSLIELHPIYANEVPADNPNPVQCIVHDGLVDILAMIEEAERMYSGLSTIEVETASSGLSSPAIDIDDSSIMAESSHPTSACETGVPPTSIFALENQIIDNLLRERWDRQEEGAKHGIPSPLSFISSDDSDSSIDSDIEEPNPVLLSISNFPFQQPLALIRAPRPLRPSIATPAATPRRSRSLTVSHIAPPTLAPLILSNTLPASPPKRQKRVHFHPSHSTRIFSIHSFAADFCTATFSSTSPSATSNEINTVRQQRLLSQAIKRSLRLPSNSVREKRAQKNCVIAFVAAQHHLDNNADPTALTTGCPHESISKVHAHARHRIQSMRTTFFDGLAPSTSTSTSTSTETVTNADTVRRAHYMHLANLATTHALTELHTYLASCDYLGIPERMDSCPDAIDTAYFKGIPAKLAERLEELFLGCYSGEEVEVAPCTEEAEMGMRVSSDGGSDAWEDVSD